MIPATLSFREILFGNAPIETRRQVFFSCRRDNGEGGLAAALAGGGGTADKHVTVAGASGAVSCGSPHAARVALDLMESGGTRHDGGGPAELFAGGPSAHSLSDTTDDGVAAAVDGATRTPLAPPPEGSGNPPVPLSGAMRAIAVFHARAGRLPFAAVAEPTRDLARHGFTVPEELATIWTWRAPLLADDDARMHYLPGGSVPQAGETFSHDGLARFFDLATRLARPSSPVPSRRASDRSVSIGHRTNCSRRSRFPVRLVTAGGSDWTLHTIGKQGWGHTLAQILLMVTDATPDLKSERDRILVHLLAVLRAFNDRPQELRSLKPKSDPIPWGDLLGRVDNPGVREWSNILSVIDVDTGAFDVPALSRYIAAQAPSVSGTKHEERDTTHLPIVDSGGMRVALTQSIGPHFDARIADPEFGILLAHSYRMEAAPFSGQRDVTEQCPSLLDIGEWQYAIGAAGSERIPGADRRRRPGDCDGPVAVQLDRRDRPPPCRHRRGP